MSRPAPTSAFRRRALALGLLSGLIGLGTPVAPALAGSGDFLGGLAVGAIGATIVHGLSTQNDGAAEKPRRVRSEEERRPVRRAQPQESAESKQLRQDQTDLATLGYFGDKVDGRRTPAFDAAVVQYKLAKGQPGVPVLTDTERALLDTEATQRELLLLIGDPSVDPRIAPRPDQRVQAALKALDAYDGAIDGKKGERMKKGIARWQAGAGLAPSGVLDPVQTIRLMSEGSQQAQARIAAVDRQYASMTAPLARPTPDLQAQGGGASAPAAVAQALGTQASPAAPAPTAPAVAPPVTPPATPTALASPAAAAPAAPAAKAPDVVSTLAAIEPVNGEAVVRRPWDVAVVIGNQNYQNGIPEVNYGVRDAEAMRSTLVNRLGFNPDNVILVENATQGDMATVFGNRESFKGKLWKYIDPDGRSKVFVFYSGHGMPDVQSKTPFILPVDADPATVTINGYPLSLVYANLEKLNVQRSYVFLDACFSGGSNNRMLIQSASPVFVSAKVDTGAQTEKLTVLAASEGDQLASWDDKEGHGLFTSYMLKGLAGAADADGDGKVTAAELHAYLLENVRRQARRIYGREQTPVLIGDGAVVVSDK